METPLITIGFDKNGEADFGVRADLDLLPIVKLNELRAMIPVAIYTAEHMWRKANPPEVGRQANISKK